MRDAHCSPRSAIALAVLLLTGAGCDKTAPRGPGAITVTASSQLNEPVYFQYGISIDSGTPRMVTVGESVTFTASGLAHGAHSVTTSQVPPNCSGGNRRDVQLRGDDTARVAITLQCARTTGDLSISVTTSGTSPDADGYFVLVNSQIVGTLPPSGSTLFSFVQPASYVVSLSGVDANCTPSPAQVTATVTAGATASAAFSVTCSPAATLRFVSTVSGTERDPDGVTASVDGAAPIRNPLDMDRTQKVTVGTHTWAIADVAPNCTLAGGASGSVTVAQGETATITSTLTCSAIGIGTVGVSVTDPASDTLANGSRNPAAAHDVRAVTARYAPGWFFLVLRFARPPLSSANNFSAGLFGAVDFDADELTTTGAPPFINSFGGTASQGSDYAISFFDSDSVSVGIYRVTSMQDTPIGRVRAKHEGDSVIVQIPLEKLGNDDGNMTVSMVVGTGDRPTDIAPNAGVITARTPAAPLVASAQGPVATRAAGTPAAPSARRMRALSGARWKVPR